ncbi:MAG: hypothetical protein AAGF84_11535 [Planctomycetota bacterium]
MRWSTSDIADALEAGLRRQARADDAEHAVYGFDAKDELGLHPLLAESLETHGDGWGVWREQRYPGHWAKRKKSEGLRCDLVLTPRAQPLADPDTKGTLFGAAIETCDAEAAYWLEVKTVAQFEAGESFKRYSAELLRPVMADVKKVWQDGVIRFGGLALVLFTADAEVADHDVLAWHTRCLEKGLPVQTPAVRGFPITDRIGNGWCAVAVFGVRG